ncbi:MAG: malate synthase A [Chloroflexi bacterium]|nr:malate synthase A [Chloroflexota bacterium]
MVSTSGVVIVGPAVPGDAEILTLAALAFVEGLERRFGGRRRALLAARPALRAALLGGDPHLLAETAAIRSDDWRVAAAPEDLEDRRVEITGPAEPKMMINALNSGARVFMADLEDALSPTWSNIVGGQAALRAALRRELTFDSPDGRSYRLAERTATLVVRPRGWHLDERHLVLDGAPLSASLVDFGLWFWHNAVELVSRGSGPYLYLPKLESHLEARLWNDVFVVAQEAVGMPRGSIRATVLIETLPAAFQMEEILFELREHAAGLNAGRWDYLFSTIKCLRGRPDLDLPDRAQLTMRVPFMRTYTERLIRTCHRRGAHAIGGMAAFIPSRRDAAVNAVAMAKVSEDKERESADGFDGTWVAHPDLVPLATSIFDAVLGGRPNQKDRRVDEADGDIAGLVAVAVPGGRRTEAGLRANVSVALAYLDSWLRGNGAAAIDNLMEDAATAEIARSLLWLWRSRSDRLDDGRVVSADLYRSIRAEEFERQGQAGGAGAGRRLADAAALLDGLVLDDEFAEFLTIGAYELID